MVLRPGAVRAPGLPRHPGDRRAPVRRSPSGKPLASGAARAREVSCASTDCASQCTRPPARSSTRRPLVHRAGAATEDLHRVVHSVGAPSFPALPPHRRCPHEPRTHTGAVSRAGRRAPVRRGDGDDRDRIGRRRIVGGTDRHVLRDGPARRATPVLVAVAGTPFGGTSVRPTTRPLRSRSPRRRPRGRAGAGGAGSGRGDRGVRGPRGRARSRLDRPRRRATYDVRTGGTEGLGWRARAPWSAHRNGDRRASRLPHGSVPALGSTTRKRVPRSAPTRRSGLGPPAQALGGHAPVTPARRTREGRVTTRRSRPAWRAVAARLGCATGSPATP